MTENEHIEYCRCRFQQLVQDNPELEDWAGQHLSIVARLAAHGRRCTSDMWSEGYRVRKFGGPKVSRLFDELRAAETNPKHL